MVRACASPEPWPLRLYPRFGLVYDGALAAIFIVAHNGLTTLAYAIFWQGVVLPLYLSGSARVAFSRHPDRKKYSKNLTGAIGQAYIEIYRPLSLRMRNCWVLTSCIDYPVII